METEHSTKRLSLVSPLIYDPNQLLDGILKQLNIKNDAALSRMLGYLPPVISKIRHRRLAVGAATLLRLHEISGISIAELRLMMGDRRGRFRIGNKPHLAAQRSSAHF